MYTGNSNVTLNARTTAHVSLGEAGALYRLGNVNNDSRVDLLWGRPSNGWTWRGALGAGGHVFGNSYITRGTTDPDGTVYP